MAEMMGAVASGRRAYQLAICAVLLLAGYQGSGLNQREGAIVQLYLVCYDCVGPLDSVRAFASRKPVATVDSLNAALVAGPVPSAARDRAAALSFVRDSTYRATHRRPPLGVNRIDYVLDARRRYDGGFRSRAAIGLGWIHDARAVADLNAALATSLPPELRQAVRYAIDSLP